MSLDLNNPPRNSVIIAVVGEKNSGKTTIVEYITHQLSNLGFTVTCLKHTHHSFITIDKKGSDTERFAAAGARTVISLAREQLVIIRRSDMSSISFDDITSLLKYYPSDFLIIEGLHSKVANQRGVYKIIVANDLNGAKRSLTGTSPPILAISGKIGSQMSGQMIDGIPVIRLEENGNSLVKRIIQLTPAKNSGGQER